MSDTVTIDSKMLSEILMRLDKLTKDVADVKERLFSAEPIYGSDEWWEWSDKKALEEIRAGKGTLMRNKKELQAHIDSLKQA